MMYRSFTALTAVCLISGCHGFNTSPSSAAAADSMAIRRDIEYLASPALAGRLTGTAENDSAAAYIARRYQSLGLRALSPQYLQHFTARPPVHTGPSPSLPSENVFALLAGRDAALAKEYVVVGAHFDHL